MEKTKQKLPFIKSAEFAEALIFILIGCLTIASFALSIINTVIICNSNKALDFSEIVSGDSHSYELGELNIDYDDDTDTYDCWLEEEQRHVYIKGKDVQYRASNNQDIILYEVDDKEILVIYFRLNLE